MFRKFLVLSILGGLFFIKISLLYAGTLVTVETQKARLTIELLKRFVSIEENFRQKKILKVLLFLPRSNSAFQDQRLVNSAVLEAFKSCKKFQIKVAHSLSELEDCLNKERVNILYIAGFSPFLERIFLICRKKRILVVSHLAELVPLGVSLSLDLERRKACIIANKESWQALGLKIPPALQKMVTFISNDEQ